MALPALLLAALAAPAVAAPPAAPVSVPASAPSVAYGSARDAYVAGQLSAILEREWGWEHGSYRLRVEDGMAYLALLGPQAEREARRLRLAAELPGVAGLQGVQLLEPGAAPAPDTTPEGLGGDVYSVLGLSPETIPFPVGDLFWPLLADPKQPQFFVSSRYYNTAGENVSTAAVGYGETFGLYRQAGQHPGDGLQLSVAGGLFAQFDLSAPSSDLVNADYMIGFPLTYRHGASAWRLRVYHQSSHLGDEFLLRVHPERVNLSFESVELLYSRQLLPWRLYAGGEYLFHHDPPDLKPAGWHAGVEYHGRAALWREGRLVGGADFKSWQEHDWAVDSSVKFGLEFGAAQPGRRRLRLMAELYEGHAPHGQFYRQEISYVGAGVYLGF